MSIVTDSTPVETPKDPSDSIIIDLYRLVASKPRVEAMENDYKNGGVGYGDFKKRLFSAYWDYFEPMRKRREELLADPGHVDKITREGASRARESAAATIKRVREACGIH
jgi:tryptophanyl-tRNA synthetase